MRKGDVIDNVYERDDEREREWWEGRDWAIGLDRLGIGGWGRDWVGWGKLSSLILSSPSTPTALLSSPSL